MWYRKQEIIKMDKQIERAGDDNKNNIGVLYGIGVGPGDPELMTLKAINTIKACDIIAIPAVSKELCVQHSAGRFYGSDDKRCAIVLCSCSAAWHFAWRDDG